MAVIVCTVLGVIIFLARSIIHSQEDSATLATARRLVVILEDHRRNQGRFPASLANLFMNSDGSSSNLPAQLAGRFEYHTDGQSYELKFEAGGPMILSRRGSAPNLVPEK